MLNNLGEFETLLITGFVLVLIFILLNLISLFFIVKGFIRSRKIKQLKKFEEEEIKTAEHIESKEDIEKRVGEEPEVKENIIIRTLKNFNFFIKNYLVLIINIILIGGILLILHLMFYPSVEVIRTYPNDNDKWIEDGRALEIEFNRPIREGVLETYINLQVPGEWIYERSFAFLPFVRTVKFQPEESLPSVDESYIYLVNFNPRDIGEYQFEFETAKLPSISSIKPNDRSSNVQINDKIEIELNDPIGKFVEMEFKITPNLEFETNFISDTKIELVPKDSLKQTQKYTVQIFRTPQVFNYKEDRITKQGSKQLIHESSFETVKAPLIESFNPNGASVKVDSTFEIKFDTIMNQDQVIKNFKSEPEINGQLTWKDDTTLIFDPKENLEKETKYKLIFAKGLGDNKGGVTESDIILEFTTIGTVKVASFAPGNGSTNNPTSTNISIAFNQLVDKASAQSKFSITPNVNGTFSWNGNTMVFNPSADLAHSTTYTVKVGKGVKTIDGLDSSQEYSSTFTTQSNSVVLNLVQYRQQNSFGCNVTATAMILSYKGTPSSEYSVIAGVGTQAYKSAGGNPHNGWVPDYGIYWEPIVNYAKNLGYTGTYSRTNWNLTSLLNEVKNGNPVLTWGQNGRSPATNISWTAAGGQNVYAVNGMHAFIVVGYEGTPESPTAIYILDSYWYSGITKISVGTFYTIWSEWHFPGKSGASPLPDASHTRAAVVIK